MISTRYQLPISLPMRMKQCTVQSRHIESIPRAATYQTVSTTTIPPNNQRHQLELTQKTTHLNNKLFIIWALFKDIYYITYTASRPLLAIASCQHYWWEVWLLSLSVL